MYDYFISPPGPQINIRPSDRTTSSFICDVTGLVNRGVKKISSPSARMRVAEKLRSTIGACVSGYRDDSEPLAQKVGPMV